MQRERKIKHLLRLSEKAKTRGFYQKIFPEDSERFLDFYYGERCQDNEILLMEEEGKTLGMLHINPYQMRIRRDKITDEIRTPSDRAGTETGVEDIDKDINKDKDGNGWELSVSASVKSSEDAGLAAGESRFETLKIAYIYAVATDPEYRHQGIMRALLEEAFQTLKEKGILLSYLIPVAEEIYIPFGYETVSKLASPENAAKENVELEQNFDIFLDRNERHRALLSEELRIAEEEAGDSGLPEHAVVMMKVLDAEMLSKKLGFSEIKSEKEILNWIRSRRILVSEDI